MKAIRTSVIAAAALLASAACATAEADSSERKTIEAVLSAYETALNASDVEGVMTLYANDSVFMPQHSLPAVGRDAVRSAYEGVFAAITLDIEFEIDEIKEVAPEWAFARTRSEGFVTINATGEKAPEANQELFLFRKTDGGEWKIARYIFSTTNSPRQ